MKQREMTARMSTCALGALLAVVLAPAGVARADQTDQDFNGFLQSQGIHLGTPAQTVKMARVMCQDLDAGYNERDEVDQILGARRLNPAQARVFVAAATADYCPQHHPSSKSAK